jgi:hypothetical protein
MGGWIRPVNAQNNNAITEADLQYEKGTQADVFDVVTVQMMGSKPEGHQTENHLINPDYYWAKQSKATWAQIEEATDTVAGPLWLDGPSSFHGRNDKVPEAAAKCLPNSLMLIEPAELNLVVGRESQFAGGTRRRVRADFKFNGVSYNFVVTDPWIEAKYFAGEDGTYPISDCRLCVSLSEVIGDHAIKLVAAVITPERVG